MEDCLILVDLLDVLAEELRCYPQQFSAWFITAFPMVYRHIKEGER